MSVDLGLLTLRLGAGALMLTHGIPKLQRVLAGNFQFGDPIGIGTTPTLFLAVFAEVVCAVAVMIGFKTRWASLPLIATMLVAVVIVHAADPFAKQELPLLYAVAFITLAMAGGGRHSVDGRLASRKAAKPSRAA